MTPFINPKGTVERLDEVSRRMTWTILAISCLAFVVFDGAAPEVGTGPLYIPLIALAGWRLGTREACGVAIAAAVLNILPIHGFDTGLSAIGAATRGLVRIGAYAFVVTTVCGLRRVYDRERHAARHDALTGAQNRASFEAYASIILGSETADGTVRVLALADIDGFKSVNDLSGHAAGDDVLCRFASAGAAAIDEGERFGRLGGDEFVFLLQAQTLSAAAARVEMVHRRLCDGLVGSGHTVGVSVGAVIVRPGAPLEWSVAIREADRLMYVAKRAGKGEVRAEMLTGNAVPATLEDRTGTQERVAA